MNEITDKKQFNLLEYINIPLFLYQDERLNRSELLLGGFFYTLFTSGKDIRTSNAYLSNLLKIHPRKVSENLESLEKNGYLIRVSTSVGRKIIWKYKPQSEIYLDESDPLPQTAPPPAANGPPPCRKRHPYTKDNNKDNKTIYNAREVKSDYQEVLYLPESNNSDISEYVENKKQSDFTFEYFWFLYPLKKSKEFAKNAWFSQKCYLITEEILRKLADQMEKDSAFLDGYVPNPAKYLTEERWKDEIQLRNPGNYKQKTNKLDEQLRSTAWRKV